MERESSSCENCGLRFPTRYARTVHQCSGGNPESDSKMLAFLGRVKEEEKDGEEKK
jgi:hypothetical protein